MKNVRTTKTRVPALSGAERWALVNERSRRENSNASYEHKFTQVASLMTAVDDFGWREKLGAEDDRIRRIWMKIRSAGG